MYIIVGLGNPGREYANTRHNIGFDVVSRLADEENIQVLEKKHKAIIGKGIVAGQKCIIAKPQTYMNLSGESVRELMDYYKIDEKAELIVVSDDISLDVGQLRVRKKGSAGGHNGLKNIIAHLGHDTFIRVKMGVGEKPEGWDLVDYVLGHFPPKERAIMDEAAKQAADAIRMIIAEGADMAMNHYNSTKKASKPAEAGGKASGKSAEIQVGNVKASGDTDKVPADTGKVSGGTDKVPADIAKASGGADKVPADIGKVSEGTDIVSDHTENMGGR